MASVQPDEPGVTHNPARHETLRASLEHNHLLGAAGSDRLHEPSADPELANERLRDFWECRRHEDGIVRGCRRHALGAVAVNDLHVLNALCREV